MLRRLPVILATSLVVIVITLLFSMIKFDFSFWKKGSNLISPISLNSSKVLGLNQWFPQEVLGVQAGAPKVTADAVMFLDTKTGEILYSKNIHQQLPIASLAKIMTVLISLEHKDLEEKYLVSERAASMEPDKMWLIPGETLTLKELLYGIFLISANDASEVLAENTTDSREEFIRLMNNKAQQIGMKNSLFVNPTGLDEDTGSSHSTAYDLALLTRYTIRNYPQIINISKTEHSYLPITSEHQDYDMYSGINLLTTYPGVLGFKTGYTPEAGLTLITLAQREGRQVLGVLLGTENRREEAKELLDFSFKKLGVSIPDPT